MQPFTHDIRVRYGDCDMQGVAFNATYLYYADDALDTWMLTTLGPDYLTRFTYQVKKATIEWSAPARLHDHLRLRPTVERWGNTSMTVRLDLTTEERHIADVEVILVSVDPATHTPTPVPAHVRTRLAGALP